MPGLAHSGCRGSGYSNPAGDDRQRIEDAGVDYPRTWAQVPERSLTAHGPIHAVEVMNTGVRAYSIVNEWALLADFVLDAKLLDVVAPASRIR